MLSECTKKSEHLTWGVVWDYCSLPQKPHKDEAEAATFKTALSSIDRWYAHPYTFVLRVTTPLPTGGDYLNKRTYEDRGWCAPSTGPSRTCPATDAHNERQPRLQVLFRVVHQLRLQGRRLPLGPEQV